MADDDNVPTLHSCDLDDPEEHFLWALVGMPDVIGAPLIMPVPQLRKISRHLWDLGFRQTEAPSKKYRLDSSDDPLMGGGGRWVDAADPEPDADKIDAALDGLKPQVQKEMLRKLRERYPDDEALRRMETDL